MTAKQIYEFGPFRLDPAEHLLLRDGKPVSLTPKAFETLVALVENSGRLVKKDDLMKRVWPETFVEEVNLAQNVSAIRRALGTGDEQYIETVAKVGYRFKGKVLVVSEPEVANQPVTESRDAAAAVKAAPALQPIPEAVSRRKGTSKRAVAGIGVAVVVLAIGVVAWRLSVRSQPVTPIQSLVILPLTNLSGDERQEYFADGITETLTTEVARTGVLRVISRTTAMHYKKTTRTVPEIGRELGVDAVLEGAVMRSGDRVRITAQLIRTANDEHVWAQAYDRNLVDALAMQSDIAADVSRQIQVRVNPGQRVERASRPLPSWEAQDAYLRGRYEWNKRTPQNLLRARTFFQKAIDLEPVYAGAWAGLADTDYILAANPIGVDPRDGFPRAKAAAQRALELDDTLGEAHASLGIVTWAFDRNWPAAEREYKRAIELNPSYATAHQFYGLGLASQGHMEEAIAEEKRAVDLDPLSPILVHNLERVLFYARKYDEAIILCRKAIDADPNFFFHRRILGLALLAQGHDQEALAELRRERELRPEYTEPPVDLAAAYVRVGQRQDALELLRELNQNAKKRYVPPSFFARIYAHLGDNDRAFEWLDRAVEEEKAPAMMFLNSPEWDELRRDPRFAKIVARIVPH